MAKQAECMTPDCTNKVKTRGVCTKCYSTIRVYVQKGKITWDGAVAAGLCTAPGEGPSRLTPMQAALQAAEEKGTLKVGQSLPAPAVDPDQEPPVVPEPATPPAPVAPPGYYYDANYQLIPIPKVQMPQVDPTPQGYAAYDPNAPAAADVPHTPVPRDTVKPDPVDPMDDIEDEVYADDEAPEQKARRQAIERRHMKEQAARYIEENGIQPPRGGNVVVVPPPRTQTEKNGDIVTGSGAGPADGLNIPPGIYIQQHDAPAQQTLDGEPLLPGWSLDPDGYTLHAPDGRKLDSRVAGQQPVVPQAPVLPTPNQAPAGAQLVSPAPSLAPVPPAAPLILPPNAHEAPATVEPAQTEANPPWDSE